MSASLAIRRDELRDPRVIALLEEHLAYCLGNSPPGSVHALDLDGLRAPGLDFWCAWEGERAVGCGALKQLDAVHGELKSMHTAASDQRRGVAAALVEHMLTEARARGLQRLSLETGSGAPFAPARALYARFGFVPCGPFGTYEPDPNSAFMTLALGSGPT